MRILDDWIERYIEFAQNTEPPRQYHLWTGISAIAACLQRRCWLSWGHDTIYPNLYVVLVGPPGGRKGTSMKVAKPLLQELGIIMSADSIGSSQALYSEISDAKNTFINPLTGMSVEHRSLSTWSEEFQVFLGDNDPKLLMAVTDLFDSPTKWTYKSIKQGTVDLSNCWFNFLGAITPTLLQTRLSRDANGGGLISRIIFVVGYGKEKLVPLGFLSKEEQELKGQLIADLEQVSQLAGAFTPTQQFINNYIDWYSNGCYKGTVDNVKFDGYNERRALHLRKLCMIVSASQSNDMTLNTKHFHKALDILEYTEQFMADAFWGVGKGIHGEVMSSLITSLKAAGSIDWEVLIKMFQMEMLPGDIHACLSSLEQAGMVKCEKSATKTFYTYINEKEMPRKDLNKTLFKHYI